jgi:predicted ATPase/class 3 adenylate cyclase
VLPLPSGTVTFVLSDIEGSTRHWQEDEAAMRGALARHDVIIRSAVAGYAGHVVKHTGDGLLAVFAGAADAIGAAVEAQRALHRADWGPLTLVVRMAVHSGEAHERDGDYFGPTLNRVARLLAAAHGGQIVVSSAAAALALERLERGITFVDVGEHRLRDLDRPERVVQVYADGLQREFPPLRSATSPLRRFPATRTRIIGRERFLAEIAERLDRSSLVTLTGVGGSGKTRLAIEAGRRVGERLPDGAAFADLSPLDDPHLIAQTVATAVGAPETSTAGNPERDAAAGALLAYLSERRMVLVLDNCEHLLEGSADLVDRLLAACPAVTVLATSRERLAVEGESILAVPSLELPSDGRAAADSAAVQLLVERATAAGAGLDLLGRHEAAVVDICRRLDGIPLALELAAAHLAHLTPEEVAGRLDDRFRLLAGGRRRIQRQATLQATVDWSYELLGETERALLARVSAFAGGFSLDAAEGVCAGDGIENGHVVALLASLVAKSLVVANTDDRVTRYRLLETIRIYAAKRLVERDEADVVRVRHRDWYLAWAERLDAERHCQPALRRASDVLRLEREIDNLRAALAWSEQEGRSDVVARLAASADVLWGTRGYQDEGLRWLEVACTGQLEDPVLETRCATLDGWITMQRGHFRRAPAKVGVALDAAGRADLIASKRAEAIGPLLLAGICRTYDDPEAGREFVRQACAIAQARGLVDLATSARGYEGMLWLAEGRYDEAAAVLGPVVESVDLEEPRFIEVAFGTELVIAHHLAGRHDEAVRVAAASCVLAARVSEAMVTTMGPAALALARAGGGATDAVLPELVDLLTQARRDRLPVVVHYVLTIVAAVLALRGDDEAASTILAAASTELELPFRTPGHYAIYRHYGRLLRRRLGDDVARRCRDAGAHLSLDAAANLAREVAGLRTKPKGRDE